MKNGPQNIHVTIIVYNNRQLYETLISIKCYKSTVCGGLSYLHLTVLQMSVQAVDLKDSPAKNNTGIREACFYLWFRCSGIHQENTVIESTSQWNSL